MARLIRNAVPIADVRFLARTGGHLFLFMEHTSVLPDFDDEIALDDDEIALDNDGDGNPLVVTGIFPEGAGHRLRCRPSRRVRYDYARDLRRLQGMPEEQPTPPRPLAPGARCRCGGALLLVGGRCICADGMHDECVGGPGASG